MPCSASLSIFPDSYFFPPPQIFSIPFNQFALVLERCRFPPQRVIRVTIFGVKFFWKKAALEPADTPQKGNGININKTK